MVVQHMVSVGTIDEVIYTRQMIVRVVLKTMIVLMRMQVMVLSLMLKEGLVNLRLGLWMKLGNETSKIETLGLLMLRVLRTDTSAYKSEWIYRRREWSWDACIRQTLIKTKARI